MQTSSDMETDTPDATAAATAAVSPEQEFFVSLLVILHLIDNRLYEQVHFLVSPL
jgi:hypothetical protein